MHENTWAKLDGCAYKQHPLMFKSTVKDLLLFTHKIHCLQTFEPIVCHFIAYVCVRFQFIIYLLGCWRNKNMNFVVN